MERYCRKTNPNEVCRVLYKTENTIVVKFLRGKRVGEIQEYITRWFTKFWRKEAEEENPFSFLLLGAEELLVDEEITIPKNIDWNPKERFYIRKPEILRTAPECEPMVINMEVFIDQLIYWRTDVLKQRKNSVMIRGGAWITFDNTSEGILFTVKIPKHLKRKMARFNPQLIEDKKRHKPQYSIKTDDIEELKLIVRKLNSIERRKEKNEI